MINWPIKHLISVHHIYTSNMRKIFLTQNFWMKYQVSNKAAWFQASAMKQMRSGIFWVTTQRTVVIPYPYTEPNYRSPFQGSRSLTLLDGTDRLSWHVSKEYPVYTV